MLYSIATAFKTLLRPSDMSNHDKGPAESLAGTLQKKKLLGFQNLIKWISYLKILCTRTTHYSRFERSCHRRGQSSFTFGSERIHGRT